VSGICYSTAVSGSAPVPISSPFKDESGELLLPFGFYSYDGFNTLLEVSEEAVHGMNLVSPYISTASPTVDDWDKMQRYMDHAANMVGCSEVHINFVTRGSKSIFS
jgi:hypothetical protein